MTVTECLKDIRERVEAATEGPWELIGGGEYVTGVAILVAPDDGGVTGVDAEFIAHARTDLPRLLDAVEKVLAVERRTKQIGADATYSDGYLDGWNHARSAIHRAITTALEGK